MKRYVFLGVLSLSCVAAAQNLVVNPGFETGNMNGWTVVQLGLNSGVNMGNGMPHTGTNYFGMGAPTATNSTDFFQSIALTIGDKYTASYWAFDQANPSKGFLSVDIQNTVIGPINGDINPLKYQLYSLTFTAAVANTMFEVVGNGSAGGKFVDVDDFSVVKNVVVSPEPPAYLALGFGAGLLLLRRRKK